jgi:hypothetical protein
MITAQELRARPCRRCAKGLDSPVDQCIHMSSECSCTGRGSPSLPRGTSGCCGARASDTVSVVGADDCPSATPWVTWRAQLAQRLLPIQACLEAAAVAATGRLRFIGGVNRDFVHRDVRHLDIRDVIVTSLSCRDAVLRRVVHQLRPLRLRGRVHGFINSFQGKRAAGLRRAALLDLFRLPCPRHPRRPLNLGPTVGKPTTPANNPEAPSRRYRDGKRPQATGQTLAQAP